MKKVFITMTMLLTLSLTVSAAQPRHHKEQEELVDSTSQDAVVVYSDTTAVDTTGSGALTEDSQIDHFSKSVVSHFLDEVDMKDMAGMLFVLGVLFILFVLAPVLIIVALFYFINKNRRERLRLAQMAMQQGQPIPGQLLEERAENPDEEYQKGLRQCFVGVGLMIFLGYAAGNVGFGVGALVFCIGLGKVFASKTAQKKRDNINNSIQNEL